jgi:DNA sulfur modification protein DndE
VPQLQLKRLRFTKEADTWLKVLKSRTGITPNLLCRMSFCLSLGEPSDPEFVQSGQDSDREINRYTLLGEYDAAFVALLRQWMHTRGKKDDSLDRFFAAHVHRGIVLLAARMKSLSDLPDLVPKAMSAAE